MDPYRKQIGYQNHSGKGGKMLSMRYTVAAAIRAVSNARLLLAYR